MATLQKTDLSDHVTYTVVADNTVTPAVPGYEITIYKEDHHHVEVVADWPVVSEGAYTTWQQFTAAIEAGNTIT